MCPVTCIDAVSIPHPRNVYRFLVRNFIVKFIQICFHNIKNQQFIRWHYFDLLIVAPHLLKRKSADHEVISNTHRKNLKYQVHKRRRQFYTWRGQEIDIMKYKSFAAVSACDLKTYVQELPTVEFSFIITLFYNIYSVR